MIPAKPLSRGEVRGPRSHRTDPTVGRTGGIRGCRVRRQTMGSPRFSTIYRATLRGQGSDGAGLALECNGNGAMGELGKGSGRPALREPRDARRAPSAGTRDLPPRVPRQPTGGGGMPAAGGARGERGRRRAHNGLTHRGVFLDVITLSCGDRVPCVVMVVIAACVIRASGTANVCWEPAVVTGLAVSIALTRRVVREHAP
jgi:hypothetical protein